MTLSKRAKRRGTALVFSAFLMIAMMGAVALSLDVGYLCVAKQELQRAADSAAMAGAWQLLKESEQTSGTSTVNQEAQTYAGYNTVLRSAPQLGQSDVTIGTLTDPADPTLGIDLSGNSSANAVKVIVRRSDQTNGPVSLFFARMLGFQQVSMQAEATAAFMTSIKGFKGSSSSNEGIGILPFALDEDTWNDLVAGNANDNWTWNESTGQVESGSDGTLEVNLFPQGTGSPGNRGTVDIGSNNNSTADIARQITDGVSTADLAHHGGVLELDDNGELSLNGDTGISAGVKDELESIKGEPRVIPIFRAVTGNGNNAQYLIVKFVGVRIMEVKLTGKMSKKRVIIQPAPVVVRGAIKSTSTSTSDRVYTPVLLVR